MARGRAATRPRPTAAGRIRSVYARTTREASDRPREALRQARDGILPVDRRTTTGDYLADWLEHDARPRVRDNTYRLCKWLIESHTNPHIGRVPLAKLAPEHVRSLWPPTQASALASEGRFYARIRDGCARAM